MEPTASSRVPRVLGQCRRLGSLVDGLQPLGALGLRLYVAHVFFASGLVKIGNWDATLALFESEFHVPLLAPHLAALLGTAAELGLPVLLALGLGTRFAAFALFVFNVVAVISYPELSDAGFKDHVLWGTMLAVTVLYGPGKLAFDHLLAKWCDAGLKVRSRQPIAPT
jgi:putative oxidoreductase